MVNVLWKAQNGAWNRPAGISPPQTGIPGKSIAASFYPPNNQLEVFTVGANGAVNLLWKAQNSAWKPLVSLTGAGAAQPGGGLGVNSSRWRISWNFSIRIEMATTLG